MYRILCFAFLHLGAISTWEIFIFFFYFVFKFLCTHTHIHVQVLEFFLSRLINLFGLFVLLQMLKISTANVILVSYLAFRFELCLWVLQWFAATASSWVFRMFLLLLSFSSTCTAIWLGSCFKGCQLISCSYQISFLTEGNAFALPSLVSDILVLLP